MTTAKAKKHKFEFLVLEQRPAGSSHPQGNRILECLEFSKEGMILEGTPRFDKFQATLSIPQNGEKVDVEVLVVGQKDNSFEVKFMAPSERLLSLISWWDLPSRPSRRPSTDRDLDIDV